jgi:glycosyltransferase involved in cell wall biosynthesis
VPKFSIIIPIRKLTDYLKESVQKIKELDYKDFEVLVITDEEENYDFGDSRFKLVISGDVGPAEKRNLGATRSNGGILAFLDDDAYPKKDWLTIAEEIFLKPEVYALAGSTITPQNATFLERLSGKILESPFIAGPNMFRYKPGTSRRIIDDSPTVNLLVRRGAFLSVGGFITDYWPGEDTKLCLDLVKKFGGGFPYEPGLIVYHHRRELLLPHLKQISRYGRQRGQFAKIFPGNSPVFPYFIPSVWVLGLFLGPVICFFFPFLWRVYFFVVRLYLSILLYEFIIKSFEQESILAGYYVSIGMFLTHIVYGYNFIVGYIKRPGLKLREIDSKTGNYIEG